MMLGGSLGPLSGGAIAGVAGVRWVFLVVTVLLALNLVWVWAKVPEVAMTAFPAIQVVGAAQTAASLGYDRLVPALREAFAAGASVPTRHHHTVRTPGEPDATPAADAGLADWGSSGR